MVGKWWENGGKMVTISLWSWENGFRVQWSWTSEGPRLHCRKIVMCCCFGEIRIFEKCWKSLWNKEEHDETRGMLKIKWQWWKNAEHFWKLMDKMEKLSRISWFLVWKWWKKHENWKKMVKQLVNNPKCCSLTPISLDPLRISLFLTSFLWKQQLFTWYAGKKQSQTCQDGLACEQ